jgi:hypothetical protein
MLSLEVTVTRYALDAVELSILHVPPDITLAAADAELRGEFVGPRSLHDALAEAVHELRPLPAQGDVLRSSVRLPGPCLWSPKQPCRYDGRIDCVRGGVVAESAHVVVGLKELLLNRKGFHLNDERFRVRGFTARRTPTPDEARRLRSADGNLLLVPLNLETLPVWDEGDRQGFLVLAEVDPADERLLWKASEELCQHPSCLGWVLPQSAAVQFQHWHLAMSLLHGRRRDVFVGLRVEALPLATLPGHVDFLLAGGELLEDLESTNVPKLALLRRPDLSDSRAILGSISRAWPED